MGILDGIFNALTGGAVNAVNAGQEAKSEFERLWRITFGSNAPESAASSIANASIALITHTNNGNRSYGEEKIETAMREYAKAVSWNQEKIELGVAFMISKCTDCTGNPNVLPMFQWAIPAISSIL